MIVMVFADTTNEVARIEHYDAMELLLEYKVPMLH